VWSGKLVHVENAAIVPALSCQGAALPCSTGQKASTTGCWVGGRRIGKFTEMGISGFGGGGRVSPKRKAHSSDKALCLDAPFLTLCYCFPLLFLLFLLDAGLYEN